MKDIIKRITARLAWNTDQSTEQTPERVVVVDMDKAAEAALRHIQMRTIFPHPAVIRASDSYGDWYMRVADVWQRRRRFELQAAPTDALQQVINSVMADRLAVATESCTTLH